MVFKCSKGTFQLVKNYRDAFKQEAFEEKYLEECFDKDMYIVGDIASEILRLKGFDTDPKSKNYYGFIDDYLDISCAFGCPHFILKRIKNEDEARKLENVAVITEDDRVEMKSITKENFDKESLVLNTSQKVRPHIVIDSKKMNAIPKGELPDDLKDDPKDLPKRAPMEPEKPVSVETFVSSSEDFDPSKKQDRFRKGNKLKDNNRNNGNNNVNNGNNKKKDDRDRRDNFQNKEKSKDNNNRRDKNQRPERNPEMKQENNNNNNTQKPQEAGERNNNNRNFHKHNRPRPHNNNEGKKPEGEKGNQ